MAYTSPALSIEDQVKKLKSRGLLGEDARIARRLKAVNYYRLSGYWHPFIQPDGTFKPGTHIDTIWDRYIFDRKLRILVMDAIERIEVSVRTQVAHHHSMTYGAFGYATHPGSLPDEPNFPYGDLISKLIQEVKRSKEPFLQEFFNEHGEDHMLPPFWMMVEVISLGTTLTMYRKCPKYLRKKIADEFDVPSVAFQSWLLVLNTIRNYCAHHSRLHNRVFTLRPEIPPSHSVSDWHKPFIIQNDRVFAVLSMCRYLMQRIAPNSQWASRVVKLIDAHPTIPLEVMGMPSHWKEHELWRGL